MDPWKNFTLSKFYSLILSILIITSQKTTEAAASCLSPVFMRQHKDRGKTFDASTNPSVLKLCKEHHGLSRMSDTMAFRRASAQVAMQLAAPQVQGKQGGQQAIIDCNIHRSTFLGSDYDGAL